MMSLNALILSCGFCVHYALLAISDGGLLQDPIGVQMAEFPLGPMFSAMMLSSGQFLWSL